MTAPESSPEPVEGPTATSPEPVEGPPEPVEGPGGTSPEPVEGPGGTPPEPVEGPGGTPPEPVEGPGRTPPEPVEGPGRTPPEPVEGPPEPSDPEDRKIITLARAARARTQADQGACVRDTDGRTYAATSVRLEHLSLSAIAVAVAMAVSSGAPGLEAVALASDGEPASDDLDVVRDLPGTGVVVWCTDAQGRVRSTIGL